MSWKSILKETLINYRLSQIANILKDNNFDIGYSLMGGNAGVALFLYYYWLYSNDDMYLEKANNLLNNNIKLINKNDSFASGNSGLMWTVNHLINNNFIEGNPDKLFLK